MQIKQINFSKFSSIKIGGIYDVYMLEDCADYDDSFFIIGASNNILLSPTPPPLMKLSKKFDYIKIIDDTLVVGGATPSGKINSFCKKHNIADFEFLSHLPGTLGGIVYMNAGLKEFEIFNNLLSIKTCKGLQLKDDVDFGYRHTDINSPILEARFKLTYGYDVEKVKIFKKMRENQPSDASAGSCFKNPKGDYAGRLIEEVGLKGKRVGGMEFSTKHANFLVNIDNGTYKDAITLIEDAKLKVYEKFNIKLECEIKIL